MPARIITEGTKLLHQQRTSIDPTIKRFQRTLLSGMGIIEQSQFGLVVGTDFEHRMIHHIEVVNSIKLQKIGQNAKPKSTEIKTNTDK